MKILSLALAVLLAGQGFAKLPTSDPSAHLRAQVMRLKAQIALNEGQMRIMGLSLAGSALAAAAATGAFLHYKKIVPRHSLAFHGVGGMAAPLMLTGGLVYSIYSAHDSGLSAAELQSFLNLPEEEMVRQAEQDSRYRNLVAAFVGNCEQVAQFMEPH